MPFVWLAADEALNLQALHDWGRFNRNLYVTIWKNLTYLLQFLQIAST